MSHALEQMDFSKYGSFIGLCSLEYYHTHTLDYRITELEQYHHELNLFDYKWEEKKIVHCFTSYLCLRSCNVQQILSIMLSFVAKFKFTIY